MKFFFRMDWFVGNVVDCLFRVNQTLTPFASKPLKKSNGNESDKNRKTKGTHPPDQDPILGTVTGVTDEWGQGVWGKRIPAGGSSATPTPHLPLLGLLFLPLHVTHHLRHHTIHKQHGRPPSTATSSFFILPTAFPNPHIHPGGKGGQPPASKLPYCSKTVAFTRRIKHIRYIISLHLALPRILCLNVIA